MAALKRQDSGVMAEKLSFLNQWRIAGLDFDVPKAFRSMFQETLVTSLLGITVIVLESFISPLWLNCGCVGLLTVPATFFFILALLQPAEGSILTSVSTAMEGDSGVYNPFQKKLNIKRSHRIVYNVAFLVILSVVNMTPSIPLIAEFRNTHAELHRIYQRETGPNWSLALLGLVIMIWLNIAQKFIGTCAMITIYRLYIDLAVQSITFLSGFPLEKHERKGALRNCGPCQVSDINSNYDRPAISGLHYPNSDNSGGESVDLPTSKILT